MADASENNASMHDIFSRSQQQFFEQWGKTLATFQEAVQASDPWQTVSESARQSFKFYDAWRESTGEYLDVLMSACPGNTGTDTFAKLFRAVDAYTKLYEFWEPLAKAFRGDFPEIVSSGPIRAMKARKPSGSGGQAAASMMAKTLRWNRRWRVSISSGQSDLRI